MQRESGWGAGLRAATARAVQGSGVRSTERKCFDKARVPKVTVLDAGDFIVWHDGGKVTEVELKGHRAFLGIATSLAWVLGGLVTGPTAGFSTSAADFFTGTVAQVEDFLASAEIQHRQLNRHDQGHEAKQKSTCDSLQHVNV